MEEQALTQEQFKKLSRAERRRIKNQKPRKIIPTHWHVWVDVKRRGGNGRDYIKKERMQFPYGTRPRDGFVLDMTPDGQKEHAKKTANLKKNENLPK